MPFILKHSSSEEKLISPRVVVCALLLTSVSSAMMSGCYIFDPAQHIDCHTSTDCPAMQTCVEQRCVPLPQSQDMALDMTPRDAPADQSLPIADMREVSEMDTLDHGLDAHDDLPDQAPDLPSPAGDMEQEDMTPSSGDMGPSLMLPPAALTYRMERATTLVESFTLQGKAYTVATNADPQELAFPIKMLSRDPGSDVTSQWRYETSRHFVPSNVVVSSNMVFLSGYNPDTQRIRVARLNADLEEVWASSYRGEEIAQPPVELVQRTSDRLVVLAMVDNGRDDTLLMHDLNLSGQPVVTWLLELRDGLLGADYTLKSAVVRGEAIYVLLDAETNAGAHKSVLVHVPMDFPNTPPDAFLLATPGDMSAVQLLEGDDPDTILVITHHNDDTVLLTLDASNMTPSVAHILPNHLATKVVKQPTTGALWSVGSTASSQGTASLEVGHIKGKVFHGLALPNLPTTASSPQLILDSVEPRLLVTEQSDLHDIPLGPEPSVTCHMSSAGTRRAVSTQAMILLGTQNVNVDQRFRVPLNRLDIDLFSMRAPQLIQGLMFNGHCAP